MNTYSANLIIRLFRPDPNNPHQPPYNHTPIQYGTKIKYTNETPDILHLNDDRILCVQSIVGALLYCSHAIRVRVYGFSSLRLHRQFFGLFL